MSDPYAEASAFGIQVEYPEITPDTSNANLRLLREAATAQPESGS